MRARPFTALRLIKRSDSLIGPLASTAGQM
jgi:hypothetical protein